MFHNYRFRNYNMRLVIAVLALTIIGIFVIGSADADYQNRQIIGMVLGLAAMFVISLIDYEFILKFPWIYYAGTNLLLLSVLVLGDNTKGATRWIDFGFIRFQPSEAGKVLLVLFFSWYLMEYEEDLNTPKRLIITAILAAVPLVLIVEEPDLSTTIVTFMVIASLMFCAGLSYKLVAWALGIGIPSIGVFLFLIANRGISFLDSYQMLRILAWLRPEDYPESSYQQQNSIMAIGSGQLLGKGLYNTSSDSVKNGNYISEPHTDFIFTVAGEELGFLGSLAIIAIMLWVSCECIRVAKKARDLSGQLICAGIASIIGFQGFVNICVVTGLFPNTGLPLPFVSYGLTSLVTLYAGIGFVLNVSLQAKKY
ncbi:MAG: rod shape-determining protein RodA [Lachnospiraceae bacterium]|nr:rod shape-determining protein RodA [Lachnospiraceae bacterium]